MSINPNATTAEPAKCTTCAGAKKKKNVQVAGMTSKDEPMLGGESVNVLTKANGSMIVTTYNSDGIEKDTYNLDKNGFQQ